MNISNKRSLTSGPNDNETNSRDIAIRIVVWHEWVVRTAPPNLEACLCVLINNHTKTNKRKNNLIFFSSRIEYIEKSKFGFKVKVCFFRLKKKTILRYRENKNNCEEDDVHRINCIPESSKVLRNAMDFNLLR